MYAVLAKDDQGYMLHPAGAMSRAEARREYKKAKAVKDPTVTLLKVVKIVSEKGKSIKEWQ